jgi:hypothetical protein
LREGRLDLRTLLPTEPAWAHLCALVVACLDPTPSRRPEAHTLRSVSTWPQPSQSLTVVVSEDLPCDLCEEQHTATHGCLDCDQRMCDMWAKGHKRSAALKSHCVLLLSEWRLRRAQSGPASAASSLYVASGSGLCVVSIDRWVFYFCVFEVP